MDKRKSILNVSVAIGFKMITMIMVILVKRFLIRICGNEVNGLNSLYISIIGFLSIAELGVGSAIVFCMYKPIVEQNNRVVSALYHLFDRAYRIISGVLLCAGLCLAPFIKYFAKDYDGADVNLPFTFILMLISVVVTYWFASKTSLINAYKNNYVTTAISSCGLLLQYGLQILVLVLTQSFEWYLVCRTVAALAQWLVTEIVARQKYGVILRDKQKVDGPLKTELLKNIRAMFMHKVGYILVNTVDSLVISIFVGVVALGEFFNYTMLLTSMTELLKLVFTALTSVFGHLYVESHKETSRKYSEAFHLLNFVLGCVFFLGYYAVIDNLIAILFAKDLVLARTVAAVITVNGFVQFMRQSVLVFREATGTFYYDRWKPLLEGILNIVLSVLLVQWFGVTGVIVATVITNLLICHIIEPYVLYKHAFNASPRRYYLKNYTMIALFIAALGLLNHVMREYDSNWIELLVNGCISVAISVCVCCVWLLLNRNEFKCFSSAVKERAEKRI